MPLPIPNLDDRDFDQLAAEARALIPRNLPVWTDYNPSDPGITLLELFAFLIEAAVYQINRVPERSLERFARLVGVTRVPGEAIEQALRRALEALAAMYRAITEEEFERLAIQAANPELVFQSAAGATLSLTPFDTGDIALLKGTPVTASLGSSTRLAQTVPAQQQGVTQITVEDASFAANFQPGESLTVLVLARAKAVVELAGAANVFPNDQIVKVIIVANELNTSTHELRQKVFEFLRQRGLITTRPKVVDPQRSAVSIATTVFRNLNDPVGRTALQQNVEQAIRRFLSDLQGGADATGWQFGRPVFRSELYQLIEDIAGVDHVRQLLLNDDEAVDEIPLSSPDSLITLSDLRVTILDQ